MTWLSKVLQKCCCWHFSHCCFKNPDFLFNFRVSQPNFSVHGFQAARWDLGTESWTREAWHGPLGDPYQPLQNAARGNVLFHSSSQCQSSSEVSWQFKFLPAMTRDAVWVSVMETGFKWHLFRSPHCHQCLKHWILDFLLCMTVITPAAARCRFEDERTNPANLVHGSSS